MKISLTALALSLALALTACGPATEPVEPVVKQLSGSGSSYSKNIITTCATNFSATADGFDVTYNGDGSGTGKADFIKGTVDFAGSDSAFAEGDEPASFTYVPVVGGPITIPFNVDGLSNLRLTAALIGQIFNGEISKWNDERIVAANEGLKLPDKFITVVYRAKSSGTTNNFAAYLAANQAAGWTRNDSFETAAGSLPKNKVGAPDSAGIATAISNTANSIGYVDLSDAFNKGLSFAAIENTYTAGSKSMSEFVKPSVAASQKFLAQQLPNENGLVSIDYSLGVKGGYPLSLLTYLIAPTDGGSESKAASVKQFVNYLLTTCAPAKATGLYYVPITGDLLVQAKLLVEKIK